jgi:hypothetical protein
VPGELLAPLGQLGLREQGRRGLRGGERVVRQDAAGLRLDLLGSRRRQRGGHGSRGGQRAEQQRHQKQQGQR